MALNLVHGYLKRDVFSHTRKVCSLYKLLCRDPYFRDLDHFEIRFKRLQIRAMFDKNKNIKDMREAKLLLEQGEQFFRENGHYDQFYGQPLHPFSKEGISYNRELHSPDYVMDWYHPLEKARFPYYFSKREAMKDEYLKVWRKKMMKPGEDVIPDRK